MNYRLLVGLLGLLSAFPILSALLSLAGLRSGQSNIFEFLASIGVAVILVASAILLHRKKVAKK